MDGRNKGRRREFCNTKHQHRRNDFWQVLPFGESKGPRRAEKQKEGDKSGLHSEVIQPIKNRFAEQEWTYFPQNPLSFLFPAAAYTFCTGPRKTLKPTWLSKPLSSEIKSVEYVCF